MIALLDPSEPPTAIRSLGNHNELTEVSGVGDDEVENDGEEEDEEEEEEEEEEPFNCFVAGCRVSMELCSH